MRTIREVGPMGVVRPYQPAMSDNDAAGRIADALDHIAVSLSAIDHNLEVLVNHLVKQPRR